jgi:hypothetical protein
VTAVCLIGDSHAHAFVQAWKNIGAQFPDHKLTFFASGRNTMEDLTVCNGELSAPSPLREKMEQTSGGHASIKPDYDAFIVCGMGFSIQPAVKLCAGYRLHPSSSDKRVPMSDLCLQSILESKLEKSLAIQTIRKLRQITQAPIAVTPTPMRNEDSSYPVPQDVLDEGTQELLSNAFSCAAAKLAMRFEFEPMLQPRQTLASPLYTMRLHARALIPQDIHMKASYGAIALRDFFDRNRRR